jgi:hypothetical protein
MRIGLLLQVCYERRKTMKRTNLSRSRVCVVAFLAVLSTLGRGQSNNPTLLTELRVHNGRPTLFINGEPHDGLFCSVRSTYMKNFIDAGFDIFDTHPSTPHGWVGDGKYDYTETDKYIEAYLKQKPDAKLILRFWFGYPRDFWWAVKYKEHQTVPRVMDKGHKMPSYASLKWREEAGEALRRVVAHVEEKYGNNVIAYVPGGGSCGEWFDWYAYTEDEERLTQGYEMGDYSKPMQEAYRKYVREKYESIENVNRIYGLKIQNFDELEIPDVSARLNAKLGHLRSIKDEQAVIDYYEVLNQQVYETLAHFARMTKEGCQRRKVVMVFYGYHSIEQPRGGVSQARAGHVYLDEVLSNPDVDYVVAPYHYDFRQLEGVMSSQAVVASVLKRGKQFLQECDGSTYLKPSWPCEDHHNPSNARESGNILRRDLSKTLMEGASLWFMDLNVGMYDSPEMVAELKRTLEIGRKLYWQTGTDNRQVAVVLHSRDAFYQREGEPLRAPMIPQFKQHELERMGLGYDDLMLENLKYMTPDETERYKFWIFPTAVRLTDEEMSLIRQHCYRNGNYVLWVYAPGVLSEKGLDIDRLEQVTGFKCGYTMEPGEVAVRVAGNEHPLLKGRKSPIVYGTYGELGPDLIRYHSSLRHYPGSDVGFSVTPRFYAKEADAVLGRVLDIDGEPAGLGVKNMGSWTSVLSVAPMVPKHILRNIAEAAGCHVYTEFLGQTYQSRDYVGFFAHETGTYRIRFPFASKVTDVFSGKVIAERAQWVDIPVRINDAILLRYEAVKK